MRTSISNLCRASVLACPLAVGCYGPADPVDADDAGDSGSSEGSEGGSDPTSATTPIPSDDDGEDDDGEPESESEGEGDDTSTDDGEVGDTTAPSLVESMPADGASGVWSDTQIRLRFSEPMDKASVQTAYQSSDLPDDFVTMSWNDAGDELILVPNGLLEYALGTEAQDVVAREYALTVTTTATDLAGNELEADTTISFTTLRAIQSELPLLSDRSGAVRQDGDYYPGFVMAGDAALPVNARWKGFMTFALDGLPTELVAMLQAEVACTKIDVVGAPYDDFGGLQLHDVEFETPDLAAFDDASIGLVVTSDEPALGADTFDVTDAFQIDLDAGADVSQFRFEFPVATDFDGEYDYALFSATKPLPVLRVIYLVP